LEKNRCSKNPTRPREPYLRLAQTSQLEEKWHRCAFRFSGGGYEALSLALIARRFSLNYREMGAYRI
jgi:hypothetical protein